MSYTNYGLLTGLIYVSVTILIIILYMLHNKIIEKGAQLGVFFFNF